MKKITDTDRLDWVLQNPGFDLQNSETGFYMAKWVCNGQPGNENGGGNRFCTVAKTPRECVDNFIRGAIKRC